MLWRLQPNFIIFLFDYYIQQRGNTSLKYRNTYHIPNLRVYNKHTNVNTDIRTVRNGIIICFIYFVI